MEDIIIASIESLQINVIDTNGDSHNIKLFNFLNVKDASLELKNDKSILSNLCEVKIAIPCNGYNMTIDEK